MKSSVYSFVAISDASMVASVKVAKFVASTLELTLTSDARTLEKDLDVLIIVNGAYAFAKHLQELHDAILGAKKIVWVQQDYSIVPPINNGSAQSPFRRAFVERKEQGKSHLEFWTTCEKESKLTPLSTYINWNCLTTLPKPIRSTMTHDDVAYYGSYRAGRTQAFDRYFMMPRCKMVISSPNKKFQERYDSSFIHHIGAQDDLLKWLSERGLGLYLEDTRSHREFHSPPNRFYEMLSAGLPMIFEEAAGMTLRKAGYDPSEYIVRNPLEISRKLDRRDEILKAQQSKWWELAAKERNGLPNKILAAWASIKGDL
jgi:hypothetical protein